MSAGNSDVFRGRTFHFEIGGTSFAIHRKLISRFSKPLGRMMENGMKESLQGSAPLIDIDEPTFCRFTEWLYTGDYNAAASSKTKQESEKSESVRTKEQHDGYVDSDSSEVGAHPVYPSRTTDVFIKQQKRAASSPKPTGTKLSTRIPRVATTSSLPTSSLFQNTGDWTMDYLPVLLSHARLYVFADEWEIPALCKLTACHLDEALNAFKFPAVKSSPATEYACATDFAQLIRYAYEHTMDSDSEVDYLRQIVTVFAANNIHRLKKSETFLDLLNSEGRFAKAVVCKTTDRFTE